MVVEPEPSIVTPLPAPIETPTCRRVGGGRSTESPQNLPKDHLVRQSASRPLLPTAAGLGRTELESGCPVALVGLVRVSTKSQKTAWQHDALDPICVKVFGEKLSGKLRTEDRPSLTAAIEYLRGRHADRAGSRPARPQPCSKALSC